MNLNLQEKIWLKNIDHRKICKKLGIDLSAFKRSGSNGDYIGRCPLPEHGDDKHPSFSINLDHPDKRGVWQCFVEGGGTFIHLVMRMLNLDYTAAKQWLLNETGLDSLDGPIPSHEIIKLLTAEIKQEDEIIIPLPRGMIQQDDEVLHYLTVHRKYSLPAANWMINTLSPSICSKGYYRDRIIIPLCHAINGRQITFQAFALDPTNPITPIDSPKSKLFPRGSPTSHTLFGIDSVNTNWTFIVEGVWDAMWLRWLGVPSIATLSSNVSETQKRAIIKRFVQIFVAFDGDFHLDFKNRGTTKGYKLCCQLSQFMKTINLYLPQDPDQVKSLELLRKFCKYGKKIILDK